MLFLKLFQIMDPNFQNSKNRFFDVITYKLYCLDLKQLVASSPLVSKVPCSRPDEVMPELK